MSTYDSVLLFIRICHFCGLAPLSMNKVTKMWEPNPFYKFLSITYIIYNILLSMMMVVRMDLFLDTDRAEISSDLFLLLLLLNQMHAVVAVVEMYLKREQQVKLLNLLDISDRLSRRHLNEHVDYENLKNKCRSIIVVWALELLSILLIDLVNYFLYNAGRTTQIVYLCAYLSAYLFGKLSYAYFILMITMVHVQIDVLNKYLRSMNKQNGYYSCDRFSTQKIFMNHTNWSRLIQYNNSLNAETLHTMKHIYCALWMAIQLIKNLHQWSFVVGLSNEFFVLTFNSYVLVYSVFFTSLPIFSVILLVVLIVNNLGNLLFIAGCCRVVVGVSIFYVLKSKKNRLPIALKFGDSFS